MSQQIKTISNPTDIEKVFEKIFLNNNNICLKTKSGNIKIDFLGFSEQQAAFQIPFVKNLPEKNLILTRYKTFSVYVQMEFLEMDGEATFILKPLLLQFISAARQEDRLSLGEQGEGKQVFYVDEVYSLRYIASSLAAEEKTMDRVKDQVDEHLKKAFRYIKIVFCNEAKTNPRVKHIEEKMTEIYIPEMNDEFQKEHAEEYNYYVNEIYGQDYILNSKKDLISEITVPVMYKKLLPIGFLQANADVKIQPQLKEFVGKIAEFTEQLIEKNRIVKSSDIKFLVSDLSQNGVGLVFNNRKGLILFEENAKVLLALKVSDEKKCFFRATVRNISILENKIIKVGCSIDYMTEENQKIYDEIIKNLGLPQ